MNHYTYTEPGRSLLYNIRHLLGKTQRPALMEYPFHFHIVFYLAHMFLHRRTHTIYTVPHISGIVPNRNQLCGIHLL